MLYRILSCHIILCVYCYFIVLSRSEHCFTFVYWTSYSLHDFGSPWCLNVFNRFLCFWVPWSGPNLVLCLSWFSLEIRNASHPTEPPQNELEEVIAHAWTFFNICKMLAGLQSMEDWLPCFWIEVLLKTEVFVEYAAVVSHVALPFRGSLHKEVVRKSFTRKGVHGGSGEFAVQIWTWCPERPLP